MEQSVALVTGAQRGIGYGIASVLASRGHRVILADVDATGVREAALKLGAASVVLDVTDRLAVERVVGEVEAEFGPISVLVNNAGINRDRMLHRMSEEEWDSVLAVNLTGQFHMMRQVVPRMRERKQGRIVNISSASWLGNVGQANYAAAKAGVIGLTKTAARELARFNITVNAICPGFIDTPMTRAMPPEAFQIMEAKIPMGRVGSPEDVGKVVAFLVSPDADYLTGEVINVGGGMVL